MTLLDTFEGLVRSVGEGVLEPGLLAEVRRSLVSAGAKSEFTDQEIHDLTKYAGARLSELACEFSFRELPPKLQTGSELVGVLSDAGLIRKPSRGRPTEPLNFLLQFIFGERNPAAHSYFGSKSTHFATVFFAANEALVEIQERFKTWPRPTAVILVVDPEVVVPGSVLNVTAAFPHPQTGMIMASGIATAQVRFGDGSSPLDRDFQLRLDTDKVHYAAGLYTGSWPAGPCYVSATLRTDKIAVTSRDPSEVVVAGQKRTAPGAAPQA
jgi:hypothetical protein